MKKLRVILSLALCAAVTVSASGCYFFPEEEEILDPPTINVAEVVYSTYTARIKDISSQSITSGYVKSKTTEDCFFTKYTGQLKAIYVKPGDVVEEGQLIAEMNNGAIAFELETQKKRVELAELNYRNSGLATDKLTYEIEKNTLAQYQDEYDGGRLYAPISGQISYVANLAPGTEVDPYKSIVSIVKPDELFVSATIDPTNNSYSIGADVTITVDSVEYKGVVTRNPQLAREEGATKTDVLQADFVGEAPSFAYLGTIADVKIVMATAQQVIVIPKHLIKTDGERTYVQILKDDVKVEVEVETGISNATEIEIKSGLKEGDLVVVK